MKIKNNKLLYLSAFILSAMLISALMALNGIEPFGSERTILWVDAGGQYISYFSYYKEMLTGGRSREFSFAKLIGGDMAGMVAYYLLSPFNLLLLLFPVEKLPRAFAVMGVLKIAAAGLTAAIFFKSRGMAREKALLLSAAYGFMSYNIIYLPNIMWLDGVIILPLIAMGIDRICENKSSLLYIAALAYGIFTNYYIGFMLCCASALYFVYKLIKGEVKAFSAALRYGTVSVMAGFVNMVVLLPVLKSLEGTSKSSLPLNQLIGLSTQLSFRELAKHILLPSVTMADMSAMLPNVFTGFVIAALCGVFFLLIKIPLRNKISATFAALVFAVSFYFTTPYYLWHGFAAPVCFEYRFAFVAAFFMILIAGEGLENIKLPEIIVYSLLVLNCASLLWYGNKNYAECNLPANGFTAFVRENSPAVEQVKAREPQDSFYRIEKDYSYNLNDAMTLGYNGLTHYSSGEKLITRRALQEAGYSKTEAYGYYGNGSTLASDGMFSIRYLLYKNTRRAGLEHIGSSGEVEIYQNPYSFPLVIKSEEAVTDIDLLSVQRGTLANEIINAAWSENLPLTNIITDVKTETTNVRSYNNEYGEQCYAPDGNGTAVITYTFISPQTTNLYVLLMGENHDRISSISAGERVITGYPSRTDHGVRFIRQVEKGEEISVAFEINGDINAQNLWFMYDDFNALNEMKDKMAANSYPETGFDSDSFTSAGVMDESGGLLLMIPYHRGWNIKVNGVKTEYKPVVDNFVWVSVPQGEFILRVSFTRPGFVPGLAVTLLTIAAAAAFLYFEKKKLNK